MTNNINPWELFTDGDKDYDSWLMFFHAKQVSSRVRDLELQRYKITQEQVLILHVVNNYEGKLTPSEISRLIFEMPHTISVIINRMAGKGLIKKERDPDRRNLVRVSITEKGKEIYKLTTKRGPIHRILSSLSEDEREQFSRIMMKITTKASEELGLNIDRFPSSD